MANRWTRKAHDPHTVTVGTDPLSRQLSQAVYDLRNSTIAKQLSGGDADEVTMQGLFKPIVATVAEQMVAKMKEGQAPQQEDVNTIMMEHLKQRLLQKQIDELDRGGDRGNGGMPKDVMAFAEGAVNIQKAAADTAMSVADRERQLRLEAEQNAAGMAQYAREEEQQKANQSIELMREMQTMVMTMMEKSHTQDMAFKDYQMNTTVESLKKTAEDAIASLKTNFQEALALKDELHQHKLDLVSKDHELKLVKQQAALPLNQDPQYLHQVNWVNWQAEQQKRQLAREDAEHADKLETSRVIREDILPQGLSAIKSFADAFAGRPLSIDNPFGGGGSPESVTTGGPGIGGHA